MKKILLVLLCLAFYSANAQESAQVQKAVQTFFEGFHARDTVKMRSVFTKEIVFQSIAERSDGGELSVETASEVCRSIAGIPQAIQFEEKLLSWNIQIDGSMAQVWTPYEFYMNGKLSHRGVNSFQLFKDNGQWKITYCIDTRRKP